MLSPLKSFEIPIDQENNKEKDQASYSSIFHSVILIIQGIVIGLLQITPAIPGAREPTIRYFLVIFFIYFVLFGCEVTLRINHDHIHHLVGHFGHLFGCEVTLRINHDHIHHLVGHFGHLFGSLAVAILVYLIFPILAIVIAVLSLCLFFFNMFRSFPYHKVPPTLTEANKSGTTNQSDQLPPV